MGLTPERLPHCGTRPGEVPAVCAHRDDGGDEDGAVLTTRTAVLTAQVLCTRRVIRVNSLSQPTA